MWSRSQLADHYKLLLSNNWVQLLYQDLQTPGPSYSTNLRGLTNFQFGKIFIMISCTPKTISNAINAII